MNEKIDKGFCISYWKLSYRRKFIRTVWMTPFAFLLFLFPANYKFLNMNRAVFFVFILVLGMSQAMYTFYKWKKSEAPNKLTAKDTHDRSR